MSLKDYYTILELPPSASIDEVKKAYRRLAHTYHPDKNGNDPYAAAQFSIIKEAYETLTNPVKKEHYLQQRWYAKSTGRKTSTDIQTPVLLLKKMIDLDRYVSRLDVHRLDQHSLLDYIADILSDEGILMLNSFNEPSINKEIILTAIRAGAPLDFLKQVQLGKILERINSEESILKLIHANLHTHRQNARWEKARPWVVALIVSIICIIITVLART